jgi:hypothetical protein
MVNLQPYFSSPAVQFTTTVNGTTAADCTGVGNDKAPVLGNVVSETDTGTGHLPKATARVDRVRLIDITLAGC